MGDDDSDCTPPGIDHDWVLTELHLTLDHAGQAHVCSRCDAVRYDDAQDARREPLT